MCRFRGRTLSWHTSIMKPLKNMGCYQSISFFDLFWEKIFHQEYVSMAKLYVSGLPHPTMDSSGKNHCNLHPQANGFKKSHQSVRGHISNNTRFGLPRFFQLGKVFPNCRLWPNMLDFLPNSLRDPSKLPWFWRVSTSFAAFFSFFGGEVGFGFFTI